MQAVIGLSDFAQPRDAFQKRQAAALAGFGSSVSIAFAIGLTGGPIGLIAFSLTLAVFFIGYALGGLAAHNGIGLARPAASPLGTGQTVGLVEFDTFASSDVSDYLNLFADFLTLAGVPVGNINNLSVVPVDGGSTPGANQDEVLLDIDDVMTIAPGAKVAVYEAPFAGRGSFQAVLGAMIDGGVDIISNSWAYCEDQTTLADVESIDSLLQNAAAAGITVLSGAGDNGSTCLDGSANTAAVPADSPNLTAVGGSSLTFGPGLTYGSETWWNGTSDTPPSGQGGFGTSKFFAAEGYQMAVSGSAMRSIPDVVTNADPAHGMLICQASGGGCPTGLLYGGTSMATPTWAAFVAILNQQQGGNLGFLNPLLYPLANTTAFHTAASMGSDFAHVGLGSPNLGVLTLDLSGKNAGAVSASTSLVGAFATPDELTPPLGGIAADGTTQAFVNVQLTDANGNDISGKTVTIAANGGSHATIATTNGVTSVNNGVALFTVTDETPETVTISATDTTDGIAVTQQASVPFVTPPAVTAGIVASLSSVANDGTSSSIITVTLQDSLGRPTPGKLVNLSQTGSSVVTGPSPRVTNASGQIHFSVTDLALESVTYTAVDVTDGSLPVPDPRRWTSAATRATHAQVPFPWPRLDSSLRPMRPASRFRASPPAAPAASISAAWERWVSRSTVRAIST